jgi:hypothetical protein
MNEKTDYYFWKNYWDNKDLKPTSNVFFEEIVKEYPEEVDVIEIGGFPGKEAVFFHKEKKCRVSILDYFILDEIVEKVEIINKLEKGSIKTIKADFLNYSSNKQYEIVCSFGFIEHFKNTKEIISKHIDLLKDNGNLLIVLPNFKGFNGWVQKKFDEQNYNAHNINSMNLSYLTMICKDLQLKNVDIGYLGAPCVWFEKTSKIGRLNKWFIVKVIRVCRFLPFTKNKLFSPFIYIKAIK